MRKIKIIMRVCNRSEMKTADVSAWSEDYEFDRDEIDLDEFDDNESVQMRGFPLPYDYGEKYAASMIARFNATRRDHEDERVLLSVEVVK